MLGWSRDELAARSKVSAATLADFEGGKRRPYSRTLVDLRRAFETAGVEFITDGLRLTSVTRGAAEPAHASKPLGGCSAPLQGKDAPASSLRSPQRQQRKS
jgi:transcriptional regulator with XRE-family HTH domain